MLKPPTAEEAIEKRIRQLTSKSPIRELGFGTERVFISEEEREANFHIIGAPSQGKSKFLEDSIRQDIDNGIGLTLLDPSDGGDTFYNILNYCAAKNHKKVLVIDPRTLVDHGKIASLTPLNSKYGKQSVNAVFEIISILFGSKSVETPRIKRYLGALLKVLLKANFAFSDTLFFSDYGQDQSARKAILGSLSEYDRDRRTLEQVFRTQFQFEQYFSSTINRLDTFWEEPLSIMFGANKGVDFRKMISEGWVILVNLFPGKYLDDIESQLIGVLIISQIIQAADILFDAPPRNVIKKKHYLYIDEAGSFATPQITTLLNNKRKTGLRLVLAHHYFSQFKDKQALDAVKQAARIKVMFNTPSYDDRLEMSKLLGYGGDIAPIDASFANQDLARQVAIIKKDKNPPVRIRIPDVPKVTVPADRLHSYVAELLQSPWYVTEEQVKEEREQRLESIRAKTIYPESAGPRTQNDGGSDSNPRLSQRDRVEKWKTVPKVVHGSEPDAPKDGKRRTAKNPKV
jgi:hypothetical protein